MSNVAKQFAGIGVAIVMHRTTLAVEIENMSKALDALDEPLRKLALAGELRKFGGDWREQQAVAMAELAALLAKANEIAARRAAAFPAFRASTLEYAGPQPIFGLVDKAVDSNGEKIMLPLWEPRKPAPDLADAAADSMLRHRPEQQHRD